MSEVIVEHLYKTYAGDHGKEVTAVDDASLKIDSEEFMVFVGPSGCGKSTTLRMIAGLEEISRGNIYIDGKRVNDVQPKDRDIAMVFQNYALYPHMSVFKNMAFGLQLRHFPKAEIDQRVREAAQILGLSDEMLHRKPKALSGGQRQRVALGRAIVRKPKVFLFDEPLSNLDAKMRVAMRAEISKLHNRLNATMIYVTHDQVEAMTMGDRICLMQQGRIQQVAEPLEIYHHPANLFVAAFIGSPSMNFFEGMVKEDGNRLIFTETTKTGSPLTLPVHPTHEKRLVPFAGRAVMLGLRPEDIEEVTTNEEPTFQAKLEIAEPLGAETHLHLTTGTHEFIVRSTTSSRHKIGEVIPLRPALVKSHFFQLADRSGFRKDTDELDTERWQAACRAIV